MQDSRIACDVRVGDSTWTKLDLERRVEFPDSTDRMVIDLWEQRIPELNGIEVPPGALTVVVPLWKTAVASRMTV